jgi:hypothetical protein
MTKRRKTKRRAPPAAAGSVISAEYRKQHRPDEFAVRLRKHVAADDGSIDPVKLRTVAEANDAWRPTYANLNVGMRFMNVSVRLRGLLRKGAKLKWAAALLLALLLAAGDGAVAEPLTTLRNDKGQVTGYGERRGNTTTFTDDKGRQTGRAERSRDGTTNFYNEKGQMIGMSRHDGRPR